MARKHRFDNRPSGYIDADEACARLGVKKDTLYTYASRGVLGRVVSGRVSFYAADDVDRLAARAAARRGHAAVAVGAMRWGEPVLDSAICRADDRGLFYRGRDVRGLIARGASFEEVVGLLWQAGPAAGAPLPIVLRAEAPSGFEARAGEPPVARFVRALPEVSARDPGRHGVGASADVARGGALLGAFGGLFSGHCGRAEGRFAAALARGLGLRASAEGPLDAALVALADHELNASTFASRIAASAGADLYACVGAALYVVTGVRHGASCDRIEALLETLPARGLERALALRMAQGEAVPGFGHALYPRGDPRSAPLVAHARSFGRSPRAAKALALLEALASLSGLDPAVDYALVALSAALDLPPGHATALFALSRTAGWVAHAFEQRAQGNLLRPRARYVGPPPDGDRG